MPFRVVFLLIPLGLLTAWLIYASTRPRENGSVPRWVPITGAVVVGAVLLQQAYMEFRWVSTERTATQIAQEIAGPEAGVHCQRWTEALLYASADRGRVEMRRDGSPDRTAMLTWEVCRDLRDWLGSDRQHPSIEQIIALHIVTHEAVHLTGEFGEGTAECQSMARDADVAESLGARPDVAAHMVRRYRAEVYPRLSSEYRAGKCPVNVA